MTHARKALVSTWLALLLASGCSLLSESVTSPSESVSATGKAIAGSFQALSTSVSTELTLEARRSGYARDLSAYVAAFVREGGDDPSDFQRGVSRVAEGHGIGHWEAEPATAWAIGRGLREANVGEAELRALCAPLGPDSPVAALALEGWRGAGG